MDKSALTPEKKIKELEEKLRVAKTDRVKAEIRADKAERELENIREQISFVDERITNTEGILKQLFILLPDLQKPS